MPRFWTTTLGTAVAVILAATLLAGAARGWTIAGILVVYFIIFSLGVAFIRMQFFGAWLCRGAVGHQRVALTFDDGPDPSATPALLELLKREKVVATFFCIGKKVAAHPDVAKRIVDDGHLIANHTDSHYWWFSVLLSKPLRWEIDRAQAAIERATGVVPKFFRPPAGLTNPHFAGAMRRACLTMVGWDVRSLDTVGTAKDAIDRVLSRTRDGSIIVLHDGCSSAERIVEIASAVIRELRGRGFKFERIDQMS